MKKYIIYILISILGVIAMAVSFIFRSSIPELLYKFCMLLSCAAFGGGISLIMVARATPKENPNDKEDSNN